MTTPSLKFEVYNKEFANIIGESPVSKLLADNLTFTEGPIYISNSDNNGYLLFTNWIENSINMIKWYGMSPYNQLTEASYGPVVIFKENYNGVNGQATDRKGRLLTNQMIARNIIQTDLNGDTKVLIGDYKGKPLNSPNDIVVKSDGTVWFTDPPIGYYLFGTKPELPPAVYRYNPETKRLSQVITDLVQPNGLAFSHDEKILYVADSAASPGNGVYYSYLPHTVYAYDTVDFNRKKFAEINPGFPDGIKVDIHDNVYITAADGVHIYSSNGKIIGKILTPARAVNLTFGSKDNNVLFIGATTTIWAVRLNTKGSVPINTV
ncbi:SMP-30/gluconolactonase/LRE family protein [uncultured virus]|nr:SMP-30/gluconolactonase/LRE family protein [uncultured virus]